MRTIFVNNETIDMAKVLTNKIVENGSGILKSILSGETVSFEHNDQLIKVRLNGQWEVKYN